MLLMCSISFSTISRSTTLLCFVLFSALISLGLRFGFSTASGLFFKTRFGYVLVTSADLASLTRFGFPSGSSLTPDGSTDFAGLPRFFFYSSGIFSSGLALDAPSTTFLGRPLGFFTTSAILIGGYTGSFLTVRVRFGLSGFFLGTSSASSVDVWYMLKVVLGIIKRLIGFALYRFI